MTIPPPPPPRPQTESLSKTPPKDETQRARKDSKATVSFSRDLLAERLPPGNSDGATNRGRQRWEEVLSTKPKPAGAFPRRSPPERGRWATAA